MLRVYKRKQKKNKYIKQMKENLIVGLYLYLTKSYIPGNAQMYNANPCFTLRSRASFVCCLAYQVTQLSAVTVLFVFTQGFLHFCFGIKMP